MLVGIPEPHVSAWVCVLALAPASSCLLVQTLGVINDSPSTRDPTIQVGDVSWVPSFQLWLLQELESDPADGSSLFLSLCFSKKFKIKKIMWSPFHNTNFSKNHVISKLVAKCIVNYWYMVGAGSILFKHQTFSRCGHKEVAVNFVYTGCLGTCIHVTAPCNTLILHISSTCVFPSVYVSVIQLRYWMSSGPLLSLGL